MSIIMKHLKWHAKNGHLEVAKWLYPLKVNDHAIYKLFQWVYTNNNETCEFGQLEITKQLCSLIINIHDI